MPSILGGLPALLGLDKSPDDLDEMKTVPNRADLRRVGHRAHAKGLRVQTGRVTRHAAEPHPLAITEASRPLTTRRKEAIEAARLQKAFNEQQQIDQDDRPAWVFPWVEQAWRRRRAAGRRQRAARRASR